MQQPDILELVPSEIKKHLDHWGDCGHIEGFGKLFNYLERNQAAADLRESIKDYFRAHRDLRGHLSVFFSFTVTRLPIIFRTFALQGTTRTALYDGDSHVRFLDRL